MISRSPIDYAQLAHQLMLCCVIPSMKGILREIRAILRGISINLPLAAMTDHLHEIHVHHRNRMRIYEGTTIPCRWRPLTYTIDFWSWDWESSVHYPHFSNDILGANEGVDVVAYLGRHIKKRGCLRLHCASAWLRKRSWKTLLHRDLTLTVVDCRWWWRPVMASRVIWHRFICAT